MMKNLIITFLFLSLSAMQGFAQFAEPAVTGASFVPNQIDQGQTSTLTISFANTGSTMIPAGSVEVTIATADTYYTTDQITPPSGAGGDLFTWSFIGGTDDIWRGTNTADISAFGGGNIVVSVAGLTASTTFETTNINVQPVSNFSSFTDAAGNNNLQPKLKIDAASCLAGSVAPDLSQYMDSNWCPATTVDLDLLHDMNDTPPSTDIVWSMDSDASDGLTSTINPVVSVSGSYYAYYYDAVNDCYSPSSNAVSVTIDANCNSAPIVMDVESNVIQNGLGIIKVLDNVTYDGTDSIFVSIIGTPASGGNIVVTQDNQVIYTPASGFEGVDSVQFQVCDENNLCDTASIVVNVLGFQILTNNCPDEFIHLDSIHDAVVPAGIELVWSTDSDGDDGLDSTVQDIQYADATLFLYYYDSIAGCYSPAMPVILDISSCNTAPIAYNDSIHTQTDVAVSGNVLSNDTDADGDDIFIINPLAMNVTGGSVTIDSFGAFTFTPDPGFEGVASFEYEVCDSGLPQRCDTAQVTISVNPFFLIQNTCQVTEIYLADIHDGPIPEGMKIVWSTDNDGSDGLDTILPSPQMVSDTLFMYYQDTIAECFGPGTPIILLIDPCHEPPFVIPNPITVLVDSTSEVCMTINDLNEDDTFTATLCTDSPENGDGTATINGNELCVEYTPDSGYVGSDEVCVIVCDNSGLCDTVLVPVTIIEPLPPSVNPEPPLVIVTPITVPENDSTEVCTVILDPNIDDTHTATLCTDSPENGTAMAAVMNGDLCVMYKPDQDFVGEDEVCIIVCDNTGLCDTVMIPVTVVPELLPVDSTQPPVVIVPPIVVPTDSMIMVCAPIVDPNPNDTYTVTSCGGPENGTLTTSLNDTPDEICMTYEPNENFTGDDEICIVVCDNTGLCDTVIIPITVISTNEPPVAIDDNDTITQDSSLVIDIQINDSDPNGDDLTTSIVGVGSNQGGTVAVLDGDSILYTPPTGFSGTDTITYEICDSGSPQMCDTAIVVITVIPSPIADAGDDIAICLSESTILSGSASGGDGSYSYSWSPSTGLSATDIANPTASPVILTTYTLTVMDGNGIVATDEVTVTVNSNIGNANAGADISIVSGDSTMLSATGGVAYSWSPASGLSTTDVANPTASPVISTTYTVVATDANGCTDTDEVMVTVVDGEPPHVIPNPITVLVDSTGEVCMTINDLNVGDTFTSTLCTDSPENGNATTSINGNELCVEYTPDGGYIGSDEICVIVCDQRGLCDTLTIPVTVIEPLPPSVTPEPPVVIVTPIVVPENDSTEVCTVVLDPNVDDTHTATLCADSPDNGTATATVMNGTLCLTYKPNVDYVGEDAICVIVCDNTGLCDTVSIPVTVVPELEPVDSTQPPVVIIPPVVVPEDSVIMVCAPIVDPNPNDTHTVTSCGDPTNGTVTTTIDNNTNEVCITYEPDDNFTGRDEICILVCDNTGLCDSVIIPITIIEDEDQLLATDDGVILISGLNPDTIDILVNDIDNEGEMADVTNVTTPVIVDAPTQGDVSVLPDGSVIYTAESGASGIDSFTYVICDIVETILCDTATVLVFVTSIDCAQAEPGVAKASDVSGDVGEQASFVLEDYVGDEVTWSIASPHAVPNNGTGDATGLVTFTEAGEYIVVFTIASNATPSGCSNPSTVFATTRYVVNNPLQECDAPTYSPVSVTPFASAIFKEETAAFVLTDGQPYTSLTWTITPTSGVSSTVGFTASTGPITFDSSGVYMIRYNYINIGDGTCEPVEGTSTAYVNVGLNPCSAPTPVLIASNPNPSDGTIATGETVTWTAGGGTPGTMSWEIVNSANVVIRSGNGNTVTHTFNIVGDYYVIFTANNDASPNACTQVVGTSETKKITVEDRDPPVVNVDPIEVEEGDSITVCANIIDPNIDDTHTATRCGGPVGGFADVSINSNGELCISYEPAPGFSGQDSMCVIVCDDAELCDTLYIPITVTPLPSFINAENDGPKFITGLISDTISVLDNDTSNENTPADLTNVTKPSIISGPEKGTATVLPDGSITYTALIGANGLDTITYVICDINNPTKCDTAIVQLYVIAIDCREAQPGVATASEITGEIGKPGSFILENYVGDEVSWNIGSPNAFPNSGNGASTGDVYFAQPGVYTVVFTIKSHSTPSDCNIPSTVFATTRYIVTTPIPECPAPSFSPVDISPSNAAVFVGDAAEFELTSGQPYTSLTWMITPSTGVSTSSGINPATGPIRFDSSGTFTIQYTYVNSGDGTCEPVEATATGFINVGLNPCTPPSPIQLTCSPEPTNGIVWSDEEMTITAVGGIPGVLSWEILSEGSVILNGIGNTLTHTFGTAGEYQVIFSSSNESLPSGCTQKVGTSEMKTVIVEDRNPPVVELPNVTVRKDSMITICAPIVDPDSDNTHSVSECGEPNNGTYTATVDNQSNEICIEYVPESGFTGMDSLCVVLCDNTGLCDTVIMVIDVERHNDPPVAINDTVTVDQEGSIVIDVQDNDSDINDDDLTTTILSGSTSGGTTSVINGNQISYTPVSTFSGMDTLIYQVCDNGDPVLCDTAIVIIEVTTRFVCLKLDAKVYLEGSLIIPNGSTSYETMMRTDLNDLRILPGQSYSEGFFAEANYSTPGQPYNMQPYLYDGDEGDLYDSEGDVDNGDAGYPSTVVDWVLVSVRSDITDEDNSLVCQQAALLHNDGRVELVGDDCCLVDSTQSFYLVIEHRSHLVVMTSDPVDVVDQTLTFDFTTANSYREGDPNFGALVGNGQKEVMPGVFAMFGGNGEQRLLQNDTDITAEDQLRWVEDNGKIASYRIADFNMNGDINFNDVILWNYNNGKFTTVPRDKNQ